MRRFILIASIVLFSASSVSRAEEQTEAGWSADLLQRILKAESPRAETAGAAPAAEMVLHSYRLTHLRVGEAGKAQNVLAILAKLLPPGSSFNSDVPANTLHVLTTASAHKAVWDYLSAVDVTEPAPIATNSVPDEVKAALTKLASTGADSAKLFAAIGTLKADVSEEIAQIDARQHRQMLKLLIGGAIFTLVLGGTLAWMLRRRTATPDATHPAGSAALALAPEQLTTALTPVHDKLRTDMLGLLNEVAIKLQAQHHEQQKLVREQQQQLEDARHALAEERRQFISEAGTMVVQAVERVDATTAKLAKQQDKVAELVEELQNTVRELDETKDTLHTKQIELEQERAKIAALSILLEEGGTPPPGISRPAASNGSEPAQFGADRDVASVLPPCTNPDQTTEPLARPGHLPANPAAACPPRFQFLPPDHPES
jgi:hypothetical protein